LRHGAPTKPSTASVLINKKKTVGCRMNTHDKVENLPFVTLTAMATTWQYMTPFRLGL